MVQVTMTGAEYVELVEARDRLNEVINLMNKENHVRFPEDMGRYSYGEWPDSEDMPKWLREILLDRTIGWFLDLPEDEFIRWVESDAHYINLWDHNLQRYSGGPNVVDLFEQPRIKPIVEKIKAELDAAADTATDDEEG